MSFPMPANEADRLVAVRALNILDTAPDVAYDDIGELAAQGAAILLISSELPEILALSRRILVLRSGRLVGELPRETATQETLLRLMAGLPDVAG